MLSAKRDARAAKRFFRKTLMSPRQQSPRVITVDKNPAYPPAVEALRLDGLLSSSCELRQNKYLNNVIEQDHRFIKRQGERLGDMRRCI
jgi:transposase, IS6 family